MEIAAVALISESTIVPLAIIADVTVPVSPVVTIVPFTSGIVNVLVVALVMPESWN